MKLLKYNSKTEEIEISNSLRNSILFRPVQSFVSYPGWKVEQNFYTKIKLIRFSSQSSVINIEFSYL